jgi:tRNA(adenine34) deaminase
VVPVADQPSTDRARAAWSALEPPWQACLEEAWTSWAAGSAGVGAVIVDPEGSIVARGRNRIVEEPEEPGVLAGTFLAHAEMNALAQLPIRHTDVTLYTSFEPCLMCAATIVQLHIPRVCYAAADPVFDGLHDWFAQLPFAADRLPERRFLGGPIGAFAHVLHLSWLAFWLPAADIVLDAHRRLAPEHLAAASSVIEHEQLALVSQNGGGVIDALGALWDRLLELSAG